MKALWPLYFLSQVIFFPPLCRPDTHNFSNKHKKNILQSLKTKARRPDIIIGVGWVWWVSLRSQSWPEETAGQRRPFGWDLWLSVSVDGQWGRDMKKKLWKVGVTNNNCHHSALPVSPEDSADGETATDWWLNHRLNHRAALHCNFFYIWTLFFFSWLPANCNADFWFTHELSVVFQILKRDRSGNWEANQILIGLHLAY